MEGDSSMKAPLCAKHKAEAESENTGCWGCDGDAAQARRDARHNELDRARLRDRTALAILMRLVDANPDGVNWSEATITAYAAASEFLRAREATRP